MSNRLDYIRSVKSAIERCANIAATELSEQYESKKLSKKEYMSGVKAITAWAMEQHSKVYATI